jgi:serine protease AprX
MFVCIASIATCAYADDAPTPDILAKLSPDLRRVVLAHYLPGATGAREMAAAEAALPSVSRSRFTATGADDSADGSSATPSDSEQTIQLLVRTRSWLGDAGSRARLQTRGARLGRVFKYVHTAVVEATPEQAAALAADSTVISVSPDRPASAAGTVDVDRAAVGLPETQSVATGWPFGNGATAPNGAGVTVAVLDSGAAPVDDLNGHILAFADFVNDNGALTTPYDDYGHGTHVSGLIAGSGADSSGPNALVTYTGIAPGANLVVGKVLDGTGNGTISNIIAGIDWVIANRQQYNIRVLSMSIGAGVYESYTTDPLCQAAEQAVQAGIVVVAAAGNNTDYGSICSPGNDPQVITVGATDTNGTAGRNDDTAAWFTSRGPTLIDVAMKPDLVAPGNAVISLRDPGSWIDVNHPETNVPTSAYEAVPFGNTAYAELSGTSMATPIVSGAAALLLAEKPWLTPAGVKASLMLSAQLLSGADSLTGNTGVYDPFTQGAGELNLPGALQIADDLHREGLEGQPSLCSTIAGQTFPWSVTTIPQVWQPQNGVQGTLLTSDSNWSAVSQGPNVWADTLVWGDPIAITCSNGADAVSAVSWCGNGAGFTWNQPQGTVVVWGGTGTTLVWPSGIDWGAPVSASLPWGTGTTVTWGDGKGKIVTWGGGEGTVVTWGGGNF